jgi:hypothetical protein
MPRQTENDFLMLRMEAAAIRDQVVINLNALIAKIDAALPPLDSDTCKPKSVDDYRKMYGMPPRRREWRKAK